jgi:hypothetical protein
MRGQMLRQAVAGRIDAEEALLGGQVFGHLSLGGKSLLQALEQQKGASWEARYSATSRWGAKACSRLWNSRRERSKDHRSTRRRRVVVKARPWRPIFPRTASMISPRLAMGKRAKPMVARDDWP